MDKKKKKKRRLSQRKEIKKTKGQETRGDERTEDWEGLLEKEMATHSNIFTQKIPWMEEPGRL